MRVLLVEDDLSIARSLDTAFIGWPERFFVWLNKVAPALVSSGLKKQLPTVKKYAAAQT